MVPSRAELLAAVDRLLQEQGRFTGLQLLEALAVLAPGGEAELAVERLLLPPRQAEALMEAAYAQAVALGLRFELAPRGMALAEAMARLPPGAYGLEEQLRQLWVLPTGRPQRDLFQDDRLAPVVAALRKAFAALDLGKVPALLAQLPDDATSRAARADWSRLLEAERHPFRQPAADLRWLEDDLAPLARKHLGSQAGIYLRGQWCRLAESLRDCPFPPGPAALHASHAWQRAGEWARLCESVESEPAWDRYSPLVLRLIDGRQRLRQLAISRALWTGLCWTHPEAASEALEAGLGDVGLNAHWQEFLDAEPLLEVVDFPAWLLLVDGLQPGLVLPDWALAEPASRAYQASQQLHASRGAMAERRQLQALNAPLLQHYLARRAASTVTA